MELLLKKDIEKLGRRGEVVKVSNGYARNYLIPKGLGVKVSEQNVQLLEVERKRMEKEEKQRVAGLKEFAEKLETYSCTIPVQANEEGHLFGSVTTQMIAEAMAQDGMAIEERHILLEDPIKELGVYSVPVRISDDIQSEFKLWVVGQ
jgi:large subunit ribosomal protein L9